MTISGEVLSSLEKLGRNLMRFQSKGAQWWNTRLANFAGFCQALILNLKANCLLSCWFLSLCDLTWPKCNGIFFPRPRVKHLRSDLYSWWWWEKAGGHLPPVCHQSVYNASQGSEGDWGITLLSVCAFLYWSLGERLAILLFSSGSWKKVIIWVLLRQILEYCSFGPQIIASGTNLYCVSQISSLLILGEFGLFSSLSFSCI